jgi:hypothetical protein
MKVKDFPLHVPRSLLQASLKKRAEKSFVSRRARTGYLREDQKSITAKTKVFFLPSYLFSANSAASSEAHEPNMVQGEAGERNDPPRKASPAWLSGKGGLKPFAGSLFRTPCGKDC